MNYKGSQTISFGYFKGLFVVSAVSTIYYLLFTIYLMPVQASAHRYHTSLTRMDYNAETKSVEISIQLFTHDVIEVLEKKHQKKIDLSETKDIDQLILAYLKDNFVLQGKGEQAAQIKWVGKETKVDLTWVYFEIPFTEDLAGAKLRNTIFFETYQEQTNYVICRFEQKKADLLFKIGDKTKEIQVRG